MLKRLAFFFTFNTLTPALLGLPSGVTAMVRAQAERVARDMQAYAQANAPWEDRTGDARAGLTASVGVEGDDVVISLYHTVDYGIWLEVRWGGQYAIIQPTIEHFSEELMGSFSLKGVVSEGGGEEGGDIEDLDI